MKKRELVFHLPRSHLVLSKADLIKYEYVSVLEDKKLFNRLYRLIISSNFKPSIKQHLLEYYLEGYSSVVLSPQEQNALNFLEEYIELYLFHERREFYGYILGELKYNYRYEILIVE